MLADSLPSFGDHHTNGPVVGPDGWLYVGQGTTTNAGVVGLENADFGWLSAHPDVHELPCRDVTLTGVNFTTPNPLTPRDDDGAVTGPYLPFDRPSRRGQMIPGTVPWSWSPGGSATRSGWTMKRPLRLLPPALLLGLLLAPAGCGSARRGVPVQPPLSLDADDRRGQKVFMRICNGCHPGGEAGLGPALNNKRLPAFLLRFQVRNGLGVMPAFPRSTLSEDELDALADYLITLRHHD